METRCEILEPLSKRTGTMLMTNYELVLFYDLVAKEEQGNIFFFNWQVPEDSLLHKSINLSHIKEIQKRRFVGKKTALELFLTTNEQFMINLPDGEVRNEFAKKLIRQRK